MPSSGWLPSCRRRYNSNDKYRGRGNPFNPLPTSYVSATTTDKRVRRRVISICAVSGCPFRICASWQKKQVRFRGDVSRRRTHLCRTKTLYCRHAGFVGESSTKGNGCQQSHKAASNNIHKLRGHPQGFISQGLSSETYRGTCCEDMRPVSLNAVESLALLEMCLASSRKASGPPKGEKREERRGETTGHHA